MGPHPVSNSLIISDNYILDYISDTIINIKISLFLDFWGTLCSDAPFSWTMVQWLLIMNPRNLPATCY